jgi:hypothetical protein
MQQPIIDPDKINAWTAAVRPNDLTADVQAQAKTWFGSVLLRLGAAAEWLEYAVQTVRLNRLAPILDLNEDLVAPRPGA